MHYQKNDSVWLFALLGLAAFTIAKTMVLHHDFVNLYDHGEEWLDKPHLAFWLTGFSVFRHGPTRCLAAC